MKFALRKLLRQKPDQIVVGADAFLGQQTGRIADRVGGTGGGKVLGIEADKNFTDGHDVVLLDMKGRMSLIVSYGVAFHIVTRRGGSVNPGWQR